MIFFNMLSPCVSHVAMFRHMGNALMIQGKNSDFAENSFGWFWTHGAQLGKCTTFSHDLGVLVFWDTLTCILGHTNRYSGTP